MRFYRYTLFNTPVVTGLFRLGSRLVLKLRGWKIRGELPAARKFIVIAYPHTSNWDVPLTLAISLVFRLHIHWMGKSSQFRGPMGPLMKWFGGIPIYLHESRNVVQQMVKAFGEAEELIVVISLEANRAYVETWKSGFLPYRQRCRLADCARIPRFRPARRGLPADLHADGRSGAGPGRNQGSIPGHQGQVSRAVGLLMSEVI